MSIPHDIKIELELVEKAKKDKRLFAPLYDIYYKRIYLFVFKKIVDEELAGDITSKTFMKALLNLDKYTFQGYPFSAWLFRIASNEVNMYYRQSPKDLIFEVKEKDVWVMMEELEIREDEAMLKKVLSALENLPLEQSELIDMRFFEQLSFKEIAEIYNITEANAKMKVYRILEKIKKEIMGDSKE